LGTSACFDVARRSSLCGSLSIYQTTQGPKLAVKNCLEVLTLQDDNFWIEVVD